MPEALYARGLAELETGRPDGAVDTFRDFLREYPNHAHAPTAAYSAARELIRAKRWDDAVALLAPYAKSYPRSPYLAETRYLLGVAQVEAGRPEGVRTLEQFIAQSPGSELAPTARLLVAEAQAKAGRNREALEQYQALVRAAPTHPDAPQALYQIGEISLRLNRPADAEAAWSTLRRDFPQHALAGPAGLATARLHEQRKQWDQALQVAQSVADRRGEERLDALLVVRAERLAAAPEPRGRAGLPCGHRRIAAEVQAVLRRAGGAGRLARGGDRQGRRQARVPGDRRHEPGSGAGAVGEAPARRARRATASAAPRGARANPSRRRSREGDRETRYGRRPGSRGHARRRGRRGGPAAAGRVPGAPAGGGGLAGSAWVSSGRGSTHRLRRRCRRPRSISGAPRPRGSSPR